MAKDVGHVAPDFAQGATANPALFGTLQIRPKVRVTLRMGDVDDLFVDPPESDRGRMARLQILGLFYFPLGHKRALEAFRDCWAWVKDKIFGVDKGPAGDAPADKFIQQALRERIVSAANAPFEEVGQGSFDFGLPPEADKPDAKNFAKIRLPGGFAFLNLDFGLNANHDESYGDLLHCDHGTFDAETRFCEENPVLGKIPLIATLEEPGASESGWVGVPNAVVHFDLVLPYELPKSKESNPPYAQFNSYPYPPKSMVSARLSDIRGKDEKKDPQTNNCPKSRGGKRGGFATSDGTNPREGLFKVGETEGFNKPHANGRKLQRTTYFSPAEAAEDPKHPNRVRAQTNEAGEAGVIFMPSQMAGDRYRIRAYLGDDAKSPASVQVETGTLVVWRNVRISRILRKKVATPAAQPLWEEAKDWQYPDLQTEHDFLLKAKVIFPNGDLVNGHGLPEIDSSLWMKRFAQAFCELEFDDGPDPQSISEEEYKEAYKQALKDGELGKVDLNIKFDPKALLHPVDVAMKETSVVLLPMRTGPAYNKQSGVTKLNVDAGGILDPEELRYVGALFRGYLLVGFLRSLSKFGALPGLTVVQAAALSSWEIPNKITMNQGEAHAYRVCFVQGGGDYLQGGQKLYDGTDGFKNQKRNISVTSQHELGHCLYLQHAPGVGVHPGSNPPELSEEAGNAVPELHDSLNICVMSYAPHRGSFCAKCTLSIGGWGGIKNL